MGINDTKFDIVSRKISRLRRRTKFLISYSLIWIILNLILILAVAISSAQYQQKMLEFTKGMITEQVLENQKLFWIITIILLSTINLILLLIKVILSNVFYQKNQQLNEFYPDKFTRLNKVVRVGGYAPFIGLIACFRILKKADEIWVELQADLVKKKSEININDVDVKPNEQLKSNSRELVEAKEE
ncbi:hypothetical protein H3143_03205 [Mycoplasma tullyi]|uniref:Uncharacterized protein n=1 Tax=Mycoplasma tullyi TaxID=1612150 RepID=A0A7D7YJZ0_9MOLU|nr:hypothetical protein [Mycoplasma tullyi]QMT98481.1 hypothetical protein H3143_03205 [Mycoplasma tullyi]